MNSSNLTIIHISPLALALSLLEMAICVLSMVSSIIAMRNITTVPLIPCLFRLVYKALISGKNDPPYTNFTTPLNFFLMFTICIFCLFMSSQLFISSFSSKFAVNTDNKLYSFSMSTIAILISIVLGIYQIPGSAAYAQAIMVALTAFILIYLFHLNNRRRKTLLSNELRDKTIFVENMRCIRLVFPLLLHEIIFNAVHLSYFLFIGRIRNALDFDSLYLNNFIGLINGWDVFWSPLVVLESIKRLDKQQRNRINENRVNDTNAATTAYFNQLRTSWN